MRHTVHLFVGEKLESVAEVVVKHVHTHGRPETRRFIHILNWKAGSVRKIGSSQKSNISTEIEGRSYFSSLFSEIVTISNPGDDSEQLYLCLYVPLYEDKEEVIQTVTFIVDAIKECGRSYLVDIYGIAYDLAPLFFDSESQKHEFALETDVYRRNTAGMLREMSSLENESRIDHLMLFQNTNIRGISLNLDKNTLIQIIGEYVLLVTENYHDVFPPNFHQVQGQIVSIGLSQLLFNQAFFTDYVVAKSYIRLLEREGIGQSNKENPDMIFERLNDNLNQYLYILSDSIKIDANSEQKDFDSKVIRNNAIAKIEELRNKCVGIIRDEAMTLPEKKACLALLIGEDDELFDSCKLISDSRTIDDVMSESIELFINEDNKNPVSLLHGPRIDGKLFLPTNEIRQKRTAIRYSQEYICRGQKRINEIEKGLKLNIESQKQLTEDGFIFGDTTYHIYHEVVEKPLALTYSPKGTVLSSIDLRGDFSPIRDQQKYGSCTAFSASSIFEYILNKADKSIEHVLSPRFLYYNVCKKNVDGTPIDNGSSFFEIIESLVDKGICEEKFCLYDDSFNIPPTDEAYKEALGRLVTEAMNVDISHYAITSALADGYPVAISLKIFDSFSKGREGFVYRPTEKELQGTDYGYHAMVICGYSEVEKVYIVRNSWGKKFGDNGYCYIPFSYIEDPQLCNGAYIVTGASCVEVKSGIGDKYEIDFDKENMDIEYSVLRVMIDEEKEKHKQLVAEYKKLNMEYCNLLLSLKNRGNREKLLNGIFSDECVVQKGEEVKKMMPERGRENKNVSSIVSLLLFSASVLFLCIYIFNMPEFLLAVSISLCIVACFMHWKHGGVAIAQLETLATEAKPHSNFERCSMKLKYDMAGIVIDNVCGLKEEIVSEYRRMKSYTTNLGVWYNEERKRIDGICEDTRDPFIPIFDIESCELLYNDNINHYVEDLWLFKLFENYNVEDETIRKYKNLIKDEIIRRVNASFSNNTISTYLINEEQNAELPLGKMKVDNWLKRICEMSVVFTQTHTSLSKNSVLRVIFSPDNSEPFCSLCKSKYRDVPNVVKGYSPFKITYIQVCNLSLEEIKLMA